PDRMPPKTVNGLSLVLLLHPTSPVVLRDCDLNDDFGQCMLCSAKSRCDLTQQFPRSHIHGAARREHLALVSGNWLATHADGCLGAAAARCRNPECLVGEQLRSTGGRLSAITPRPSWPLTSW